VQADSDSDSESRHRSPRQVGIIGWRPIIGADCRPVAIMELTSEDAILLLIASDNVHLKLKREREAGFM